MVRELKIKPITSLIIVWMRKDSFLASYSVLSECLSKHQRKQHFLGNQDSKKRSQPSGLSAHLNKRFRSYFMSIGGFFGLGVNVI